MTKRQQHKPESSIIDDVRLRSDYGSLGPPICFSNALLRQLLTLGKAKPTDVFVDLGSGWGQTIQIALTEFGVAKAIGIEAEPRRYQVARQRRSRWLKQRPDIDPARWVLKEGPFNVDTLLTKTLKDATLVFYGLQTDALFVRTLEQAWSGGGSRGRRLLYYYNCTFPEIMPSAVDLPFFVSRFPFVHTKSDLEWLMRICGKEASSLKGGAKPSIEELWGELKHDYHIERISEEISSIRSRLRKATN